LHHQPLISIAITHVASAINPLNAKQHHIVCIINAKRFFISTTIRPFKESRIYRTIFWLIEPLLSTAMHYSCTSTVSNTFQQVDKFRSEFNLQIIYIFPVKTGIPEKNLLKNMHLFPKNELRCLILVLLHVKGDTEQMHRLMPFLEHRRCMI